MKEATLTFPVQRNNVNNAICYIGLGLKKHGLGVGKWNGFGGKIKLHESIRAAAARELEEECLLKAPVSKLVEVGEHLFTFPAKPEWNMRVHVFIVENLDCINPQDNLRETSEMIPRWFPVTEIPYALMWPDDAIWLPLMLKGGRDIRGDFIFKKDNESLAAFKLECSLW